MSPDFARLTPRERECLGLMTEGLSSKEIADQWKIRADSVDRLVLTARAKLGGLSRHRAVCAYFAYRMRNEPAESATRDRNVEFASRQPSVPRILGEEKSGEMGEPLISAGPDFADARQSGSICGLFVGRSVAGQAEGTRNDLGWDETIFAMGLVATGALVTAAAGLSIFGVLDLLLGGR